MSIANCGAEGKGGMARCHYEPRTRKLAVLMIRLDGKPLEAMEHNLGQVSFQAPRGAKLQALQVADVQSASRSVGPSPATQENSSTNAER